ncbi:hypothetical protein PS928_02961 [Pseudomonas fluorescens]|uniref:Uncharacterized protein n=1 Tax=Pseudomonas fluorescens TaxID=294 RepID=A0A5E7U3L2_PSEFL|nr:hypothetical protein PS928_02961 [Pseudomonas fluorescens]
MLARFVVVPAVPKETGAIRQGIRFYCQTEPIGFDIYDNQEKRRLNKNHSRREDAEAECRQLNR